MSNTETKISAKLVADLRAMTGAGMMDCKKFLQIANGDLDKAVEEMRKAGATKAAKKDSRTAAEGLVVAKVSEDSQSIIMLEINCETDFVARSDDFIHFAQQVAQCGLEQKCSSVEQLMNQVCAQSSGDTVEVVRQNLVVKLGEKITLRRLVFLQSNEHLLTYYLHGSRIGVLVEMDKKDSELGRDIAMHIAATKPEFIRPDQVSAEAIEHEREIFSAQAAASGKPKEIIEKMVQGRISKFVDEVTLLGQPFVKDSDKKVGQVLKSAGAEVLHFTRFEVGEGIDKVEDNFVEEVIAQARK